MTLPRLSSGGSGPRNVIAAGSNNSLPSSASGRVALLSGHLGVQSSGTASFSGISQSRFSSTAAPSPATMSSQPQHPTLMIPGPVEFDDAVLNSMSHFSESHVGPGFVNLFGETLGLLRKLFQTTDPAAQPFVISGSGTLGWDLVAANLVERDEPALVLGTGYFSDGFAECLQTYGADVTELKSPPGQRPQLPEIEKALGQKKYKILTVTHVDTSTGVLSELRDLTALVRRVSPETLVIVDGVCSVAGEELAFDEWDLDGVVTASQKAIGVPAGLSISMFSGRAMATFKARRSQPSSYFGSMKKWLPIMQSFEARKPAYFATPSPQLIHALHTSLSQILARPLSERFAAHRAASDRVKKAVAALGLKQVADDPANQAHLMTAIYLPEGLKPTDVLPGLAKRGVIFAGGIHKEIATKYIRFGHMGISINSDKGDLDKSIKALGESLAEAGYNA